MQVPVLDAPNVAPSGPASGLSDYQQAQVSPEAAGVNVAQAAGGLADTVEKHALAFQGLQNETNAKNLDIQYSQALDDLQFNPKNGLLNLKGQAAIDAYPAVHQKVMDLYQQYRGQLASPEAQSMFDQVAVRRATYTQGDMSRYVAQQNQQYIKDVGLGRISQAVNESGLYWNDDSRFARNQATIADEVDQLGQQEGAPPEKIASDIQHYQSEAVTARVKSVLAVDANKAQDMLDQAGDSLDAPHRAVLQETIQNHQYTQMMRDNASLQRDELLAQRNLRLTQQDSFAKLAGPIFGGAQPDATTISQAVTNKQITPEMGSFLTNLPATVGRGAEDPTLKVQALTVAGSGAGTIDDVMNLAGPGRFTPATISALVKTTIAKQNKEMDAGERGAFSQLRTAMSIGADEKPLVDIGGVAGARAMQLWSQAQGEWNDRVHVKNEPYSQVLPDILQKYSGSKADFPTWLPQPSLGAITAPEDIPLVVQRLQQAQTSGRISVDQAQVQAGLIKKYSDFFDAKAQADQAKKTIHDNRPKPGGAQPAGISPSGVTQ